MLSCTGNCGIFATCITEKRIANHIRAYHVHQSERVTRCKDSAIFCSVTHSKGSDWCTWPALVLPVAKVPQSPVAPYTPLYGSLYAFTCCKDSAISCRQVGVTYSELRIDKISLICSYQCWRSGCGCGCECSTSIICCCTISLHYIYM